MTRPTAAHSAAPTATIPLLRLDDAAIAPEPAPPGTLTRLGLGLRAHPWLIRTLQILVVLFYLALLILPALQPLPGDDDHILNHLTRFAQFVFWGLWWPGVILAVMLLGRFWCGVLCPEGALSEWVSHIGLGRGIPRWMKWPLWPFIAFVLTTVYGQLISVYEYPQAALLILGGSTIAAMFVGLLYGRGKRVWCRHLCPVSGVFALLARLSLLHFRVNRTAWDTAPAGQRSHRRIQVNCAPMLDIRRMDSAAKCHACGRCAGQRDAVQLAARAPNAEIVRLDHRHTSASEAALLLFGMLGVAIGAFQWSASPWFVIMKQLVAEWLVGREWWWALGDNAPWWLLTHYPQANDVFSWLDGALIVFYIGGVGLILGSSLTLTCLLSAWLLGRPSLRWPLAHVYTPLAGISLILGLSMTTLTQLQAEGLGLNWITPVRLAMLLLGVAWTLHLGWQKCATAATPTRRLLACLPLTGGTLLITACWLLQFFVW